MRKYEVSVVVLTYYTDLNRLLFTLHSVLLQQNVDLQIIIADDGSENNFFQEVEKFFEKYNFSDYILLPSEKNRGIVINYYDSLCACSGKYIKGLSPGDMLYGREVLRNWIDYMKKYKLSLSFSDAFYYRWSDKNIDILRVKTNPQWVPKKTNERFMERLRIKQIIYDDNWLGVVELVETQVLQKFLSYFVGKVKYTEDSVYKLMGYSGIRYGYFDFETVLYEYGTGISTSNNIVWEKRIYDDWVATNEIIKNADCFDKKLQNLFFKKMNFYEKYVRDENILKKAWKASKVPGYLWWKVWAKVFPRYSRTCIEEEIVKQIMTMDEN